MKSVTITNRSRYILLIAWIALSALDLAAQPQSWTSVAATAPGTEIRIAGPRSCEETRPSQEERADWPWCGSRCRPGNRICRRSEVFAQLLPWQ